MGTTHLRLPVHSQCKGGMATADRVFPEMWKVFTGVRKIAFEIDGHIAPLVDNASSHDGTSRVVFTMPSPSSAFSQSRMPPSIPSVLSTMNTPSGANSTAAEFPPPM